MSHLIKHQPICLKTCRPIGSCGKKTPIIKYWAGEDALQWGQPYAASDLVHCRNHLGDKGIAKLFALSMALHTDQVKKARKVMVK